MVMICYDETTNSIDKRANVKYTEFALENRFAKRKTIILVYYHYHYRCNILECNFQMECCKVLSNMYKGRNICSIIFEFI